MSGGKGGLATENKEYVERKTNATKEEWRKIGNNLGSFLKLNPVLICSLNNLIPEVKIKTLVQRRNALATYAL